MDFVTCAFRVRCVKSQIYCTFIHEITFLLYILSISHSFCRNLRSKNQTHYSKKTQMHNLLTILCVTAQTFPPVL